VSEVVTHDGSRPRVAFVGAAPRVDLLPAEVRDRSRTRAARRLVFIGVLGAVAIVIAGYFATSSVALSSQLALSSAESNTNALYAQIARFQPIRSLQDQLATAEAADRVSVATRLDWQEIAERALAGFPFDNATAQIALAAESPVDGFAQPTVPLQGERIGSVGIVGEGPDLAAFIPWIERLKADDTFADVVVSTALRADGGYDVTATAYLSPALTAPEVAG